MKTRQGGTFLRLRRRSVWEAADAGILIWRNSFPLLIIFFAIPVWVCSFLLMLIPFRSWFFSVFMPGFILWWLKPLFDRCVLCLVSAQFFRGGEKGLGKPGLKEMAETLRAGLAGDLLWRRFSPFRSAVMPLRVLERAGRKAFGERKAALMPGGLRFGAAITVVGLIMEAGLLTGEIIFLYSLAVQFHPGFDVSRFDMPLFLYVLYSFNMMLVESLYVCMGFGLYIRARVENEGWDLELLFKRFARALVCVLLLILTPAVSSAREKVPLDSLERVLSSDDFGYTEPGWSVRFKGNGQDQAPLEPPPEGNAKLKEDRKSVV
jgi:hypothetical protein